MQQQRLGEDVADAHARIQGPERVLEHHLRVAAEAAQLAPAELQEPAAAHHDLALIRLDEPQQAAAERRLPRAALADEGERPALLDLEVDPVDRDESAARSSKRLRQSGDADERLRAHRPASTSTCADWTSSRV